MTLARNFRRRQLVNSSARHEHETLRNTRQGQESMRGLLRFVSNSHSFQSGISQPPAGQFSSLFPHQKFSCPDRNVNVRWYHKFSTSRPRQTVLEYFLVQDDNVPTKEAHHGEKEPTRYCFTLSNNSSQVKNVSANISPQLKTSSTQAPTRFFFSPNAESNRIQRIPRADENPGSEILRHQIGFVFP